MFLKNRSSVNSAEIIDPDYNELATALLHVPPKGHDYVAMKLMNPFDNRISWELPFLVDTGTINVLITYHPPEIAIIYPCNVYCNMPD